MNKKITPLKAIRANCLDCMIGSYKNVKECKNFDCALYLYRLGKYPNNSRKKVTLSRDRKKKLKEYLQIANQSKLANSRESLALNKAT